MTKLELRIFAILAVFVCLAGAGYAGPGGLSGKVQSGDALWKSVSETEIERTGKRSVAPEQLRLFKLNAKELENVLAGMPLELTEEAGVRFVVLSIPNLEGKLVRFRIEESPVLSPSVAAEFPSWKTFSGKGIDDPTAVARFDWSGTGFHGYVMTLRGTYLIDPFQSGDREHYVVYSKEDLGSFRPQFHCNLDERLQKADRGIFGQYIDTAANDFSHGATLRTYKVAIATTGEYTQSFADQNTAFNDVMSAVNRINTIYRREFAVALQLVSNTSTVYPDPNTDPYNNTDQTAQLTLNHQNLNTVYGNANYDIGHLFGTGGGGVATSPSVCDNTVKGEGYSARVPTTGDPFWVDYVSHEMGHQFSADHTYNELDSGTCNTRSATDAYEVASGSTIMSYVGICDARNLQQYSQDNFHVRSLTSIITYVNNDQNGGATCGTPQATGNSIPVIGALTAYTIPKLTPFTLTASATDADAGDSLTYLWEQYDLAPSASGPLGTPANTYDVDTDGVERPLFRSYTPSASPSRTFPSLTYILNNSNQPPLTYMGTSPVGSVCENGITCAIGENMPSIARTMNFRVSVRDNHAPTGAIADAGTTVTVVNTPGPFKVTSQNQNPATWQGQSQQTVTWDVSSTDQPPISTANVNILLSTDGGSTFPTTLAANTPNDGTQMITVPNIATTTARIKVEAAGNIYFDINDVNFSITTSARRTLTDFDGDGKTDVSIFRPNPTGFAENLGPEGSSSQWWILRSGDVSALGIAFGTPSDVLVPADFTGDGKTDVAFFRPSTGTWFVLRSEDSTFYAFPFGTNGDIPAPGDFDGDGKSDPAVYRPSTGTWFILRSSDSGISAVPFGIAEDRPTVADFDGDGKADVAQYRPSLNQWWQLRSSAGVIGYQFGASGDKTAIGDYTGDGKADIAFYRPSTSEWFVIRSEDASFFAFPWGAVGDISTPGDYDGDGTTDAAVFRPSNNTWFINGSTSGFQAVPFGTAGDVPLPNAYAYSGSQSSSTSFPGTGVGAIPDGGAGPRAYGAPRNVSFNVTGLSGTVSTVEVDFNASHTYVGDLKVTLIAPNSTQHKLFETTGATTAVSGGIGTDLSSGNTYTFRDSSTNNWWTWVGTGDPVPTGNARTVVSGGEGVTNPPMVTSLNTVFAGLAPNGVWVLRFEDGFSDDIGTVTAANLKIGTS